MNPAENTEPAPVKKKHRGCLFLLLGLMAAVLLLVLSAAFLRRGTARLPKPCPCRIG